MTAEIKKLERFAVEKGKRSGGRGSGRPRRMSLKTTLFRRNDGSAAFEIGQFQKQNALKVACYCPSRVGLRVVASDPTPRPDVRMVELAPRARRARCSSFSRATTVLEAVGVAGTGVGAGIAGAL